MLQFVLATIPGCAPCEVIKPLLQDISQASNVPFSEINVIENEAFRIANSITVTPTVLVFDGNLDSNNKIEQYNGVSATNAVQSGELMNLISPMPEPEEPTTGPGLPTNDPPITFSNSFSGLKTLGLFGVGYLVWRILK